MSMIVNAELLLFFYDVGQALDGGVFNTWNTGDVLDGGSFWSGGGSINGGSLSLLSNTPDISVLLTTPDISIIN